ncbi:MFS transporter [Streptomyces sp. MUM 203J]|uniref:MFS transporter n=1 Tax=Streptomyces sp. MUM 203J TaxID=2791990 RepID=UPI001F04F378|nr:MFS transporter [Streptomyces sp. MUM 203J]
MAALLLASTLTVMAGTVLAPVVSEIRTALDVSGTAAGLILTAHGLSLAVVSPVVGWTIDRWGLRTPMSAGLILYGVAGGAGLFTDSYGMLIASRFLFGIGAAAVFTGTTVALMALFQGPERDKIAGWRSTAIGLGGVVWPLLAGGLAVLSWHGPFAVYLIGIPVGIAMLITMPNVPPAAPGNRGGIVTLLRTTPRLLVLYALSFLASFLLYVLIVFLPQRFDQLGIDDPVTIAVITASVSLAGSVSGFFYGTMRANLGYSALLRMALALWGLGFLVGALVSQPVLLALSAVLFGAGSGISVPALAMLTGESSPAAMRGQAMALSGTANFAGQFSAPVVIGPLVGATSITSGFLMAAALAGLVLIALFFVRLQGAAQEPQAAQEALTVPSAPKAGA